jgi:hypothetical protein
VAIFLNYRRGGSMALTVQIDAHLPRAFGDTEVYRGIDSIPPGVRRTDRNLLFVLWPSCRASLSDPFCFP